jgi:hypothetical protein
MKGKIDFKSKEGKGSVFSLVIPTKSHPVQKQLFGRGESSGVMISKRRNFLSKFKFIVFVSDIQLRRLLVMQLEILSCVVIIIENQTTLNAELKVT